MRLESYFDIDGKIALWPARKRAAVRATLRQLLVEKFEIGKPYSELEVNAILNDWHTFGDPAFLRRDLVDHGLMKRSRDCRKYERIVTVCPGRDSNPHGLAANGF